MLYLQRVYYPLLRHGVTKEKVAWMLMTTQVDALSFLRKFCASKPLCDRSASRGSKIITATIFTYGMTRREQGGEARHVAIQSNLASPLCTHFCLYAYLQ